MYGTKAYTPLISVRRLTVVATQLWCDVIWVCLCVYLCNASFLRCNTLIGSVSILRVTYLFRVQLYFLYSALPTCARYLFFPHTQFLLAACRLLRYNAAILLSFLLTCSFFIHRRISFRRYIYIYIHTYNILRILLVSWVLLHCLHWYIYSLSLSLFLSVVFFQ